METQLFDSWWLWAAEGRTRGTSSESVCDSELTFQCGFFCYGYISVWQSNHSTWYTSLHFVVLITIWVCHSCLDNVVLKTFARRNRFCSVHSSCMWNSWFQPSSTTSHIKQDFHPPDSKLAVFKACSVSGSVAGEPILMRHHVDLQGKTVSCLTMLTTVTLNVVNLISVIHIKCAVTDAVLERVDHVNVAAFFPQFLFLSYWREIRSVKYVLVFSGSSDVYFHQHSTVVMLSCK